MAAAGVGSISSAVRAARQDWADEKAFSELVEPKAELASKEKELLASLRASTVAHPRSSSSSSSRTVTHPLKAAIGGMASEDDAVPEPRATPQGWDKGLTSWSKGMPGEAEKRRTIAKHEQKSFVSKAERRKAKKAASRGEAPAAASAEAEVATAAASAEAEAAAAAVAADSRKTSSTGKKRKAVAAAEETEEAAAARPKKRKGAKAAREQTVVEGDGLAAFAVQHVGAVDFDAPEEEQAAEEPEEESLGYTPGCVVKIVQPRNAKGPDGKYPKGHIAALKERLSPAGSVEFVKIVADSPLMYVHFATAAEAARALSIGRVGKATLLEGAAEVQYWSERLGETRRKEEEKQQKEAKAREGRGGRGGGAAGKGGGRGGGGKGKGKGGGKGKGEDGGKGKGKGKGGKGKGGGRDSASGGNEGAAGTGRHKGTVTF